MDNERFIEILKTKKCSREERDEFMVTLANGKKSELSDVIVSYYNYEDNVKRVIQYIFDDLGQGINKLYCDIMTVDDYHQIVDNHNAASVLSKIFASVDEYEYVVVDTENNEIEKYHKAGEVISDFLIGIDFFQQIEEDDFALIIDEINSYDMFYDELE